MSICDIVTIYIHKELVVTVTITPDATAYKVLAYLKKLLHIAYTMATGTHIGYMLRFQVVLVDDII
jgi:hypothetical protein